MKSYRIRSSFGLPLVTAVIVGPKGASRVELVFDSGAANTQLHIGTLEAVGLSFAGKRPDISVRGVTGTQAGHSFTAKRFHLFGKRYEQLPLAAYDFTDWAEDGIDGLLRWDLIQKLQLEMNGPRGELRIF
ncbi:MAG: hypothetical protein DCC75_07705 [Proteobacteria bacterium]|nr:MAG: hypothetical protein DCC75_07705 [Pseudomonadota bacterium]